MNPAEFSTSMKAFLRLLTLPLCLVMLFGCGTPKPSDDLNEISVSVTVPDAAWTVRIQEVYVAGDELWVLSKVSRSQRLSPQVISTVTDTVPLSVPNLKIKHFIVGKTWDWTSEDPHTFIAKSEDFFTMLPGSASRAYPRFRAP